jgi:NTE family protein
MGITVVQKSDLSERKTDAKRALVLAGGAISGGAFKVGGLMALNRYLRNFSVTDFDIYMGISAGAFLAAPLAAGIPPRELYQAIHGRSPRLTPFNSTDFYVPNWRELIERPFAFARELAAMGPKTIMRIVTAVPSLRHELMDRARLFVTEPNFETAQALVEPLVNELTKRSETPLRGLLPSGLFDNRRIEAYVRHNIERNGIPNNFRQLKLLRGKSLYIGATDLNTAQGVVFGHDEDNSVSISEAVQASTAIPGFFKPTRLGPPGRERDYCDAAIRKTANISTAVRHGAQLVICYNPFRPFVNYRHRMGADAHRTIADLGLNAVLNQAFRTLLYSRLRLGIQKLRMNENFKGDVILIEPAETDARFFSVNPLAFWKRKTAAQHGFESVSTSLAKHHITLRKIFGAYGIEVDLDAMEGGISGEEKTRTPPEEDKPAGLRVVHRR